MRNLVTGGTGFTGSHLVERLLERGDDVVALDHEPGLFAEQLEEAGADLVLGSVTNQEVLDAATEGVDVVYHLAAAFRDLNAPKSVYWDVNVEGTRNVLEAAQKHDVAKVVYCSTQGVHGHVDDPPGDEESPIEPEDYYQYTKYEGEVVCHEFMDRGMDISIVRPTAIYGPGDPGRWLMLFKMAQTGRFLMFGDGETTYHPVYINNLVDLFLLAAEKPEARGQTYLGGDERYYTLNEIVRMVAGAIDVDVNVIHLPFWPLWIASAAVEFACKPFPIEPPLFRRRADWYRQVRAFSIEKAKRELGYEPRVSLSEGLRVTAEWYQENGYL